MTCPQCQATITKADFRINETIGVCQHCARSLVREKGKARFAAKDDLHGLTPGQITDLRHARPTAWRNDVRARHTAILGRRQ